MINVSTKTKTLRCDRKSAEYVVRTLRAAGIHAELDGVHGGDGLYSQGGRITGASIPETVHAAMMAGGPRPLKSALDSAIGAYHAAQGAA